MPPEDTDSLRLRQSEFGSSGPTNEIMHENLLKEMHEFNQKYGTYVTSLCQSTGIDETQIRTIIAHESRFKPKIKNEGGSIGYMQLTTIAVKDFFERPDLFLSSIKKIREEDIPEEAPKELKEFVQIYQKDPLNKEKLQEMKRGIVKIRGNTYVNLFFGSLYFHCIARNQNEEIPSRWGDSKIDILLSKKCRGLLIRKVRDIIPNASPNEIMPILEAGKGNEDFTKELWSYWRYNGNDKRLKNGVEMREIYAGIVLVVTALTKKDGRSRLLGISDLTLT